MARIPDIIQPIGRMNLDDDARILKPGETRELYNVRTASVEDGKFGTAEFMKGNTEKTFGLPTGRNKIIGEIEDREGEYIYYFIWNSLSSHSIVRYNVLTEVFEKIVWRESVLNFQENYYINNPRILGGILFWTDGYFNTYENSDFNPPRSVDIDKAYNYYNSVAVNDLYKYPTGVDSQSLDVIKYPPLRILDVTYGSDTTYKQNNLRGRLFQFIYRYIYYNKQKSVWSPVSNVALPQNGELANGDFVEDETVDNYLIVPVDTGSEEVVEIEIAKREGESGQWESIEVIQKYDTDGNVIIASNLGYGYVFYNNVIGIPLFQKTTISIG